MPYVDKTFIYAGRRARAGDGRLSDDAPRPGDRLERDRETALPAFLVIAGVPLTFSISAGIGFGILGYIVVMVVTGRWAARSTR